MRLITVYSPCVVTSPKRRRCLGVIESRAEALLGFIILRRKAGIVWRKIVLSADVREN